nr:ABC transporter permease [Brevibacillus fulvus]
MIWLIFRKELTDLFRDRKTVIGAFVIPIAVIPAIFFLVSVSMSGVEEDARANVSLVILGDVEQPLGQRLLQTEGVKRLQPDDPLASLHEGEVRAIVTIPDDLERHLRQNGSEQIRVRYDAANDKSVYAYDLIQRVIADYEQEVVAERLQAAGLEPSVIHPLELVEESVASEAKMTGKLLSGIVPLMLILSLATGGIAAATDLVAGEKERGTMEALISAPVPAGSILTAKLLTVMVMSGISSVAALVSSSLIIQVGPFSANDGGFALGFLGIGSILLLVLILLLLAAMFAGLELAISTWAKTFKEAQTYMTPVLFAAMVPSYMMLPLVPADIPLLYYVLPIFNGSALCKEIFFGEVQPLHVVCTLLSSLVYVAAVIWLAAALFRREKLLIH